MLGERNLFRAEGVRRTELREIRCRGEQSL